MDANNTDMLPVLVVGGGPSGLMVAHELKRFGIPCTIIEKEVQKSPYSRAIAVQIRTLEIFHALGLIEKLREKSQDVNAIQIFAESQKPLKIAIGKTTSFFERLWVVDQPHTEKVLEDALLSLGQKILTGVELVNFLVDERGVRANLKMPHGEIKAERFSYVIGADGVHSLVRKKMSNQFSGSTYEDAFILADAECNHAFDHHTFRIFFRKQRFLALIPMHGENHYRLISVRRGETKKAGPLPTIEEFQELAKSVVPFPLEIKNPVWVSRFFVQCRSAARYQEDRVFLVGDAAHIHSPAGGQGMNTGLQDAFNLAWKLALTMKGIATPNLLETYHVERKPVGDFLIDRTDRLFKFMVKSSIWARLLRRFVLPYVARTEKLRARLFTIGSQTAIRYETGAVCSEHSHAPFGEIKLGKRVPNLRLITSQLKKTDLHTLAAEPHFSCWFIMPAGAEKKQIKLVISMMAQAGVRFGLGVKSFIVFANDYDAERSMGEADYGVALEPSPSFMLNEPFFVIVRPDHHVFCYGLLNELPHALEELESYIFRGKQA